jgi:hypothetical protein
VNIKQSVIILKIRKKKNMAKNKKNEEINEEINAPIIEETPYNKGKNELDIESELSDYLDLLHEDTEKKKNDAYLQTELEEAYARIHELHTTIEELKIELTELKRIKKRGINIKSLISKNARPYIKPVIGSDRKCYGEWGSAGNAPSNF